MYEAQVCSLEKLLAIAETPAMAVRVQALLLRTEGWTCEEIGDELGCHADTVSRWGREFARSEAIGVKEKRPPGRPAVLNEMNTQLFRSLIFLSQSYDRPYRGKDIQFLLHERGISMLLATLYESLHRQNFSYQTARPFNPNRDETQVSQWKESFPSFLTHVAEQNLEKNVKVFFQDETRFGQKGTISSLRPMQTTSSCRRFWIALRELSGEEFTQF